MTTDTARRAQREWILSVLQRYEIPLTRYAKRLLGDEPAAHDVVQHVFLRLCDHSPAELQDRLAPWLYAVCRNKAMDGLRARQRARLLGDAELPSCISREPDPAAAAESHDLYEQINQAVEQLPGHQGEALTLWAEGFSNRQIAEILATSEGNVRVLVHRALKTLRQHPLARRLIEDASQEAPGSRQLPNEVPL